MREENRALRIIRDILGDPRLLMALVAIAAEKIGMEEREEGREKWPKVVAKAKEVLRLMEGLQMHVVLCTLFDALLSVIYAFAEEEEEFVELVARLKRELESQERRWERLWEESFGGRLPA